MFRCAPHQTRPRMSAFICLGVFGVPSIVVCICVLSMISWNALHDAQPCNYYIIFFVSLRSAVVHQHLSATSAKSALKRFILGKQQRYNNSFTSSLPLCDRHGPSLWLGVTLYGANVLYCTIFLMYSCTDCIVLYCTVLHCSCTV